MVQDVMKHMQHATLSCRMQHVTSVYMCSNGQEIAAARPNSQQRQVLNCVSKWSLWIQEVFRMRSTSQQLCSTTPEWSRSRVFQISKQQTRYSKKLELRLPKLQKVCNSRVRVFGWLQSALFWSFVLEPYQTPPQGQDWSRILFTQILHSSVMIKCVCLLAGGEKKGDPICIA